ncbi:unnamed protein product [Effrenium voratum]|uniref:Uncharacterized protein n=1 Tax=Effrenium voratum TaxID=2562239 RepID=A0AA36MQ98_9DINO|nr:unnamed protein product [Effrenium voratum]|mmetsp:Transcript_120167/g.285526  ORF Transcript_120167/g.285526 Transcript_120167/m.285526 type:complete len:232 (+) Transcript_120167:66-761(+)
MASWSQLEPTVTTLALRGISKLHTLDNILQLLDFACASTTRMYNFVYMPTGNQSHSGLAIVNFVDDASCRRCFLRLQQMQEEGSVAGIKSIGQSYIQGFAENLAYYAVVAKQDDRITEKPIVFVDGMPVTDAMLDQLIKHFVTNDLAARASQRAEALYKSRKKDKSLSRRPRDSPSMPGHRDSEAVPEATSRHRTDVPLGRPPTAQEMSRIRQLSFALQTSDSSDVILVSL